MSIAFGERASASRNNENARYPDRGFRCDRNISGTIRITTKHRSHGGPTQQFSPVGERITSPPGSLVPSASG
jgi:hypothetical protein